MTTMLQPKVSANKIRFSTGQCSLGAFVVAMSAKGICALLLGDTPNSLVSDLKRRFPKARAADGDARFEDLISQVAGFIEAPRHALGLPLDMQGTVFQQRVWRALRAIPVGGTASYSDIAQRIGSPQSVRAVAQACAANPIAVAVPCHRVVRSDGNLSGYRWGVARKRLLLEREAVAA